MVELTAWHPFSEWWANNTMHAHKMGTRRTGADTHTHTHTHNLNSIELESVRLNSTHTHAHTHTHNYKNSIDKWELAAREDAHTHTHT